MQACLLLISYLIIFNYIILIGFYAVSSNYIDHAEPNIAAVAWLFQTKHPLYPGLEYPQRYINNYGPTLYMIHGFFLNLFKPTILSSKIGGVLAVLISLVSLYFSLKKVSDSHIATICCAGVTLIFLSLNTFHTLSAASFWPRPDPLLLMCVSVALLAALRTPAPLAALVCALSLGISTNLKLFAILYFLPIYVLLYLRIGFYYVLASIVSSTIVAVAPFLCFQNISSENYLLWLRQVSHQGLDFQQFRRNVAWMIYACIPIIAALLYRLFINKYEFNRFIRQNKIYICVLMVSVFAVVTIGAKPGAQENNLLPLIPVLSYFLGLTLGQVSNVGEKSPDGGNNFNLFSAIVVSTTLAWVVSALIVVIPNEASLITKLIRYPNAINDIDGVVKSYPDKTIGVGYGKSYELSFYRPFLVFLGNPYLVDAASLMEMQQSGINQIPSETLAALRACQIQLWLIPKGEKPFQLASYYPPNKQVFTDEFKSIFLEKYEPIKQTKYYDLWSCKDKSFQ